MPKNRLSVTLSLLRHGGLASCDATHGWRRTRREATAGKLGALASDYAKKSERDNDALERMVFFAQTGFCRWRVLLEGFGEALAAGADRCGHCDNCVRLASQAIELLPEPEPVPRLIEVGAPTSPSPFDVGDAVKAPRYGEGVVESIKGEEIGVRFPDKSRRTFLATFLKKPRARRAAPRRTEATAVLV